MSEARIEDHAEALAKNTAMAQAIIATLQQNDFDTPSSVCTLLTAATSLIEMGSRPELRLSVLNAFLAPTIEEWVLQQQAAGATRQ